MESIKGREDEALGGINSVESTNQSFDEDEETTNVKVICRVRPAQTTMPDIKHDLAISKKSLSKESCIEIDYDRGSLHFFDHPSGEDIRSYTRAPKQFAFDHVAPANTSQAEFFEYVGKPLVDSTIKGINTAIFCYGQTGSGKTYTMFGKVPNSGLQTLSSDEPDKDMGLAPRAVENIFAQLSNKRKPIDSTAKVGNDMDCSASPSVNFHCTCSFYEIYKERVYDLLAIDSSTTSADESPRKYASSGPRIINNTLRREKHEWRHGLSVREDIETGAFVEGLREVELDNIEMARKILLNGHLARRKRRTIMNTESSRSHAIFCFKVSSSSATTITATKVREGSSAEETNSMTTETRMESRFWMVDLAGSERQGKFGLSASFDDTENSGKKALMKEASYINKSLVTLGLVISDLAVIGKAGKVANGTAVSHFRDSKLTFLLKDALCGNSRTVLVANISPNRVNQGETLSTLKFAQRTMSVRTMPIINQQIFICEEQKSDEQHTMDELRAELNHVKFLLSNSCGSGAREKPRGDLSEVLENPPSPSSGLIELSDELDVQRHSSRSAEEFDLVCENISHINQTTGTVKYSKDAAKEATAHCSEASTSEGCNDDIDRVSFQEKTMDRSIESCSNLSELSISAAPIKNNSDSLAGKVSAHLQQLAALISTHKLSADLIVSSPELDEADQSVETIDDSIEPNGSDGNLKNKSIQQNLDDMVAEAVAHALQAYCLANQRELSISSQARAQLESNPTTLLESAETYQDEVVSQRQQALRKIKVKMARNVLLEISKILEGTVSAEEVNPAVQGNNANAVQNKTQNNSEVDLRDQMLRALSEQLEKVNNTLEELHERNHIYSNLLFSHHEEEVDKVKLPQSPSQQVKCTAPYTRDVISNLRDSDAKESNNSMRYVPSDQTLQLNNLADDDMQKLLDVERALVKIERIRQRKLRREREAALHPNGHTWAIKSPGDNNDGSSATHPSACRYGSYVSEEVLTFRTIEDHKTFRSSEQIYNIPSMLSDSKQYCLDIDAEADRILKPSSINASLRSGIDSTGAASSSSAIAMPRDRNRETLSITKLKGKQSSWTKVSGSNVSLKYAKSRKKSTWSKVQSKT